jgi:methylated-DNA-[protein]-cysteine S-methyltransferase
MGRKTMKATMNAKDRIDDLRSCAVFKTAIGWCGLVMARGKVRRLYIGYASPRQLKRHIRNAFGDDICFKHSTAMKMIIQKLRSCCAGKKVSLSSVPLDWSSLTPFQQKVLRAAARIPCGSVATYGGLARKIGSPRGARAVGNALGRNPFPLLIPCHRVIKGDGGIGGFSGVAGVPLKKKLLGLEGVCLV